jgi:hypothetical protein
MSVGYWLLRSLGLMGELFIWMRAIGETRTWKDSEAYHIES